MGVFGPCAPKFMCGNTFTSLTIYRPTRDQNSVGEVVLSFADIGTLSIDLQPTFGGVIREIHGQLARISFMGIIGGNPDIQEFDRAYVSNALIEVVEIERYGDHAEVSWKWVR